jgi:iron complex outermembrane receptor protein
MSQQVRRALLLASIATISLPLAARADDAAPPAADEIVVSAARTPTPLSAIPALVTIVDSADLEQQLIIANDTSSLLANMVPGFAPSRQKLSGFGESFRGRSPLYLIDGVPQSNPLRDGSRDGYTIDLSVIDRIEVINGANAIQGLGATGGIVNYVTKKADPSGDLTVGGRAAVTAANDFAGNGFEYKASVYASKRMGDFDAIGSVGYVKRGLYYDGAGRSIGIDTTQGDLADSRQWNFFGKVGWEPTGDQRLQLTVNRFRLEGDGDFQSLDGDRERGIPTTAIPGAPEGKPATNAVWTASLDYHHSALLGGRLDAQLYYQDFAATFGGGTFATFQDPLIAPVGTLFDQSQNRSEKLGGRLTLGWKNVGTSGLDVITGADVLRDRTAQALIFTDRNWVPETEYRNAAPFLQLDYDATDWLRFAGGARWEFASLKVGDFVSIAGNRDDFERTPVEGGSPSFDHLLVNGSAIVTFTEGVSAYASYSQGYTVPDVGRVLRGVSTPGTDVDSLFALNPVIADNYEGGLTLRRGPVAAQLAYYISKSDEGVRLVPNADGILSVAREKTRISGFEGTLEAEVADGLRAGGNISLVKGRVDTDDDGRLDSGLDAVNIAPNRLNLYVSYTKGPWSLRAQSATLFDKDLPDDVTFDGYTLVDLFAGYETSLGTFGIAVQNLADKDYITYFGQAAPPLREDRFFAGRGRTFTLSYAAEF